MVDKNPYLVPIPGTRKLERLKENAGASDILLTPEEAKKIDTMLEKKFLCQRCSEERKINANFCKLKKLEMSIFYFLYRIDKFPGC